MSYKIRVSPTAAAQIRAAAKWWKQNRDKAPEAFGDELDAAYRVIAEVPNAGEPIEHTTIRGLRRVLLGRVQYQLYYRVDTEARTLNVLAVWHSSRGDKPF